VPTPWTVYSASVGRSPWQRAEVRSIQGDRCAQCANPVVEVHHRRALSNRINQAQAGYQARTIGLCHACHLMRTLQQNGQADRESRMLQKCAPHHQAMRSLPQAGEVRKE
jgi:hypothetical protein